MFHVAKTDGSLWCGAAMPRDADSSDMCPDCQVAVREALGVRTETNKDDDDE